MKPLLPLLAGFALLSGCVAPVGPVEVTRFHAPNIAALGKGAITIEAAPGTDGTSLEFRSYAGAVSRQLALLGYAEQVAGASSGQVAQVRLRREVLQAGGSRSPVSVGIGGSTGTYGSGLGLGIGLNLSGPPPQQISTELAVIIKDRASGAALWEGRAQFTVRANSPMADTQLGAARLAEALFKGFPGQSGETIQVK